MTGCHAPASNRNSSELLTKARRLWDKQVRLSRASLDRELGRIGLKFEEIVSEALVLGGTPQVAVTRQPLKGNQHHLCRIEAIE